MGVLKQVSILENYPSGSGLANYKDRIYLIGDDASHVLVMDPLLKPVDRIDLFTATEKRIPKAIKQDLEAITIIHTDNLHSLLLLGSGSLDPYRNSCWIINLLNKEKVYYSLDTFYNRLKQEGITDLNIEGVATTNEEIILASRGNKSFGKNFLIFTPFNFWMHQDTAVIRIVKVGGNKDTAVFNGISGLDYSASSDRLLMTVSTEDTYSSHGDGAIGKSYLWIVSDFSAKKNMGEINADIVIDLDEIDSGFNGQKIESIAILSENEKETELLLVSDDDKGGTVLFRLSLDNVFNK